MDLSFADPQSEGPFEARYLAFLETVANLRPRLHRYCARMTSSILDGEDIVQEALFLAYRKLDQFEDGRPLAPWLFRIAHNQCIDFLRRKTVRLEAERDAATDAEIQTAEPTLAALDLPWAVERLVVNLPPKERACVLLKDVLGESIEEIAEVIGSTAGGVKAALHRGRGKLARLAGQTPAETLAAVPASRAEIPPVYFEYVDRFNRRDWEGLRALIRDDARLRVADRFAGSLENSPYFGRYAAMKTLWRMAVGWLEGVPVVVSLGLQGETWIVRGFVRIEIDEGLVVAITDYRHCPWMASWAEVSLAGAAS